jgi:L-ribulose-5-phosphate 3-epimerase
MSPQAWDHSLDKRGKSPIKTRMSALFTRRHFLGQTASAAALVLCPSHSLRAATFRGRLRKSILVEGISKDVLLRLKQAGFEGVETNAVCPDEEAAQVRAMADELGMRVHTVQAGGMRFNSSDAERVENSIEMTRLALRAARAYGADVVNLVPCRVDDIPMPDPREFKIQFDEKTSRVTHIMQGDDGRFIAYIQAQNQATDSSRAAIEKLIPLAQELRVVMALENVLNNLWVTPELFHNFVASFASPWVKVCFDIADRIQYAPPPDWMRILGPLIVRLHIKDFLFNPDGRGGRFVHLRDGSVDWPAVRQAIDKLGYDGWATIADAGLPIPEFSRRFDLIANGQ